MSRSELDEVGYSNPFGLVPIAVLGQKEVIIRLKTAALGALNLRMVE